MTRKDWEAPELFGLGFDAVQDMRKTHGDPRPYYKWRRGAVEVRIEPEGSVWEVAIRVARVEVRRERAVNPVVAAAFAEEWIRRMHEVTK